MNRRQASILDALCNDCPAWTATPLAQLVCDGDEYALARELKALGHAVLHVEVAARLLPVAGVVHRHEPGVPYGDTPGRLASFAAGRTAAAPRSLVRLIRPTERTLKIFGGRARGKNPFSVGHDLLLAAARVASRPLGLWLYEAEPAERRRHGEVQPDAAVLDPAGRPRLFVEALGGASYTPERIGRLLEYADGSGTPMEFV